MTNHAEISGAKLNSMTSFRALILVGVALIVICFVYEVNGCSFRRRIPINSSVDEFVFVGTVIGHTNPIQFPSRVGTAPNAGPREGNWYEARGLQVKVSDAVALRRTPKEYFEVFPYFHSGVCDPLGVTNYWLQRFYPVGTKVLIVGELSTFVPFDAPNGNLRLEIRPGTGVKVATNLIIGYVPTADSIFDYKSDERTIGGMLSVFELRKDVVRLEKTESVEKRIEILNRILNMRDWAPALDLFSLLRKFVPDKALADAMYEKKLVADGLDKKRIKLHLECVQWQADGPTEKKRKPPC